MSIELIHFIEELAANAWPAAVVQGVDGWRLRFNWGITRRANSVLPIKWHAASDPGPQLQIAEEFYTRRETRVSFQMCPATQPAQLDDVLSARGYTASNHTSVQIAAVKTVSERARRAIWPTAPHQSAMVAELDDEWFNTYAEGAHMASHERAMRRGILERIGPQAGYARVRTCADGRPVAVGLGVVERGWTGIFCMETLPEFRRQGAAMAIIGALAQWGESQGASQMYLQVMLNNGPAGALYTGLGFEPLYTYYYRECLAPAHVESR